MARPSHREQVLQKKMLLMGGGILALIIFLLIFGLNSLINIGSWIGTITGNKTQTVEKQDDFFGTLFVDDLPPATNSAELIVSGNTSSFDMVEFKINGRKVNAANIAKDNTFSERIGALKEGLNTIQVIAKSRTSKQVKESDPITVTYKKSKPKLDISTPHDGDTIKGSTPEVTIQGTTDPGNTVEVGGAPVTVGVSGSFQTSVRLKDGDNSIIIIAQDDATNQQQVELKLKYSKDD